MHADRNAERRKVFYYLQVEDAETGRQLGRLGDISTEGIMLLCSRALPLETVFRVAVRLPDTSSFSRKKLELSLETRWLRPDVNPEILCIGCRLLESEPEKDDILDKLIEYYGFSEGYKKFRQPQ
jgi:PilZ domain